MVIGSYDKAKKFHPMALMITMHETGEDFKFFFSAINQHRPLFNPTTLIADAAAAITNGFQAVWSLIHRVTCWAHAIRAIRKNMRTIIKDKEQAHEIQLDICNFAKFVKQSTFIKAAQLMIIKMKIGGRTLWFVRSTDSKTITNLTDNECKKFSDANNFVSFSSFLSHYSKSLYFIEIVKPVVDGLSTCSCPKFLKEYKCKHLLSLLYRRNFIDISDEHKQIAFGLPRRRGRPRLNDHCLMEQIKETQVDLAEHVLSDTDTEDESDHRAATAKTKVVKKSVKKQKEVDQVDQDFDIFAEEPRRRSTRQSFA